MCAVREKGWLHNARRKSSKEKEHIIPKTKQNSTATTQKQGWIYRISKH